MYRYTTPTITCELSGVEFDNVDVVRIAVKGTNTLIVREVQSADITDGTVVIKLTQEETANLGEDNDIVSIQARIKYNDGTVQATNKVRTSLLDVLDKVVI